MVLTMGKWGCWLVVAVHIVVRGKEAMDKRKSLQSHMDQCVFIGYPGGLYWLSWWLQGL